MMVLVAGPGPPAGNVLIRLDLCIRNRCVAPTTWGLCDRHAAELRKERDDGR